MKKNKKKKPHIPARLNVLFFGIFVLFSILVIRLAILQLIEGEDYLNIVQRTEEVLVDSSVPRGKVYDRNGNVIVDTYATNDKVKVLEDRLTADTLYLTDAITGTLYAIQIRNGQLVSFIAE